MNECIKTCFICQGSPRKKFSNIPPFLIFWGFFYGRMFYKMQQLVSHGGISPGYQRNKKNFELTITSNVREEVETTIRPFLILKDLYPVIVASKVAVYGITATYFKFSVKKYLPDFEILIFDNLTYKQCSDLFEDIKNKLLRRWYITLENDFLVMTIWVIRKRVIGEKELQQH